MFRSRKLIKYFFSRIITNVIILKQLVASVRTIRRNSRRLRRLIVKYITQESGVERGRDEKGNTVRDVILGLPSLSKILGKACGGDMR